jgi:uncharacterized cysteine cluster protein YcgN (CxxCxxCC family)
MSFNLLTDFFGMSKYFKIPREIEARFPDESLCQKCGRCCYGSIPRGGTLIIISELPCRYLVRSDDHTATCSIYGNRHAVAKWCQTVNRKSVNQGLFPADCPYVRGIPNYRGKAALAENDREEFYRWVKDIFDGQPRPDYLAEKDWNLFFERLGLKP